jgi:DNA polymerase-3 subunit epsilon
VFDYAAPVALVGQRTFDDLGAPLSEVPFCVLDLETTGLTPDTCEITEIGAVRFVGGVECGRFHTLVNPRAPIPPTVTVMTGITQAMVVDAPMIEEALPAFLEFLGDAVIVGHNVRFDIAFLNAAALRLGYGRLEHRSADTLRLARRLLPGETKNLRLSGLAARLGSPVTPTHRAFDDAMATAHVFWALLERAGSIGVTHLDDLLALPTIKGSRAIGKLALTERLPRRPGVYMFRDREGDVIYVGKATDLRSRVRSYFAGDHRSQVDAMLRDLARIDHIATTSEIEAAVVELRMIHELRPRYNRRSKPPRALHWVAVTDERFPRLSITRTTRRGLTHLGPFRTRRTAELVMHALWDTTRIRRCSAPGRGCDYAQLGWAVCPCDGTIDADSYRRIVDDLLGALDGDPRGLLTPLTDRLSTLVTHQRFEEAAACRDGWGHLAHALRRRRRWISLQRAGHIVARRDDATIAISHGRLVAAWPTGTTPPLVAADDSALSEHPATMADADEAALLWTWLTDAATELVEVVGELALPASPVPDLVALPQATEAPGGTSRSGARSTTPRSVSAPRTRTSERKPAIRLGANPVTTTTWRPTSAAGS